MTGLNNAGLPAVQWASRSDQHPWERSYPPGVDWRIDIPDGPLWKILDDARRDFPDRPALEFLGKVLTYEALASLVDRAAEGVLLEGREAEPVLHRGQ